MIRRTFLPTLLLLCTAPCTSWAAPLAAAKKHYNAHYVAEIRPQSGVVHVELKLSGERLPKKIVLHADPRRQRAFTSTDALDVVDDTVTWQPRGKFSRLNYDFVIDHERAPGRYDSLLRNDWAVFRGDKMVPRARVTAVRGLESDATLEFVLPEGWAVITPYGPTNAKVLRVDDPTRRFDRPQGWMLAGKLGSRAESIAGIQTLVAAPTGDSARRQDMLAFLNWNLPQLAGVFPTFPKRLLIVSAGDPMWRGGLSGPASLFLHSSRPLISENRTSALLHELVHVAMGIYGDGESDWIAEGLAEYYSIETLRRSGGIGKSRYDAAIARLAKWSKGAPTLFAQESSGARTARAVIAFKTVDAEIRAATAGKASLDDVARALATHGGRVTLERLQSIAAQVAGRPLQSLERSRLSAAG